MPLPTLAPSLPPALYARRGQTCHILFGIARRTLGPTALASLPWGGWRPHFSARTPSFRIESLNGLNGSPGSEDPWPSGGVDLLPRASIPQTNTYFCSFSSRPFKLRAMCRLVNNPPPPKIGCTKKHAAPFVLCATGRVYFIPFSCGAEYIGQTGRCINDRFREHEGEVTKTDEESHHPMVHHLKVSAPCAPEFSSPRIVGAKKNRYGRDILKAYAIKEAPRNISAASLSLLESRPS